MKKSCLAVLLALATLLFLLPALVACSSGNTEIFYCNVFEDDFGILKIEEKQKNQADYFGERTYDKDGVLVSCLIREKFTNYFVYELTYNPDGTIATVLNKNDNTDEYKYNENGLCIAINTYCYEYDEEGKCVKSYDTSPEKNYLAYTYNENGQLCEITQYKLSKNTGEYNEIFIESRYYDQNGNITEAHTDRGNDITTYEYKNGKLFKTTTIYTGAIDIETAKKVHEYDENGNEISFYGSGISYYDEFGFCTHCTEYQYDDRGNKIKESTYEVNNVNNTRKLLEEYVFEYDNNDNPTSLAYFSEQSLIYKIQYTFTKDDVCKKSVVTHSDGNVVFEHKGYVDIEFFGDTYSVAGYSNSGLTLIGVTVNTESGAIIESGETELDKQGLVKKFTYTIAPGYVQVSDESSDSLYDPDGKLIIAVKTQPIDHEVSHVTVYNSENQVVFECDAEFNRYTNPGGFIMRVNNDVVEYCIWTVEREYVTFIYENGVLRVETE